MTDLDPVALKLIHSTQSAIPFDLPFWERLASGLFATPEKLGGLVQDLVGSGVLLGWQGELNPDLVEAREALGDGLTSPGIHVRWSVLCGKSPLASTMALGDVGPPGWASKRCRKCWGRLRPEMAEGLDLLAADSDRTTRAGMGDRPRLEFAFPLDARLAQALLEVRAPAIAVSPWVGLGESLGAPAEAVVAAAKRLVVSRVLRRVRFRYSARALGFAGCALAAWAVKSPGDLDGAAEGLAGLSGVADVFTREADVKTGANLTCLFLGRAKGTGADAARRVGEQWGLAPAFVEEIDMA